MRGDIIVDVDGVPAADRVAASVALISGSPQWTHARAVIELASGADGSAVSLGIERAGKRIAVTAASRTTRPPPAFEHPALGELEPGVWYVDLGRATMQEIEAAIPKLASARVVVDMRGYPNANSDILTHIISKPDTSKWMHVAHIIRPFQRDITAWEDYGWQLAPASPHLDHVVFVTGPDAISYAESVLGYVQYEGIPLVGAASAGTNGNVRVVDLPTGARFAFTGMRVTKSHEPSFVLDRRDRCCACPDVSRPRLTEVADVCCDASIAGIARASDWDGRATGATLLECAHSWRCC